MLEVTITRSRTEVTGRTVLLMLTLHTLLWYFPYATDVFLRLYLCVCEREREKKRVTKGERRIQRMAPAFALMLHQLSSCVLAINETHCVCQWMRMEVKQGE